MSDQLLTERNSTHGNWRLQSGAHDEIMQAIWKWDTRGLPAYQRIALFMIAGKISRIIQGDPNFKDHWDDIAGYATLASREIK